MFRYSWKEGVNNIIFLLDGTTGNVHNNIDNKLARQFLMNKNICDLDLSDSMSLTSLQMDGVVGCFFPRAKHQKEG